jgi:uncharacterized protein (TIGR02231 family)
MFRMPAVLAMMLVLLAASVRADDIIASSSVEAVTVFTEAAEVTRVAQVEVPAGSHVIILKDLPANTVENSVRVEGLSTGGLEVTSVDTRVIFVKQAGDNGALDDTERRRLTLELDKQRDERAALDGEIEAANTQKTLAQNLAQIPIVWSRQQTGGAQPANALPDWPALFDLVGSKVSEVNAAIGRAKIRQRAVDERIKELEAQLNRQPADETERLEVAVMVDAKSLVKANLVIRYQVPGARWLPVYDARLDTGGKSGEATLSISRRAEVTQETGEDWSDVALTLSTTRPEGDTQAPELTPVKVEFRPEPKPAPQPRAAAPSIRSLDAPEAAAPPGFAYAEPEQALAERKSVVAERGAAIEASAFQAAFRIPGKSSVKSGVGARRFLIASDTVKPVLRAITTPKESAAAFFHATFTHDSAAPYLPGRVALYRDGIFVGTGELPLLPSGEEHDMGFGTDDAIKVTRVSLRRARGETGIITSSNVDEQHYKITLTNLHDRPIPLLILDQMPYSEDEKIIAELLPITSQPVEMNYEDKRGVVAWALELKPKQVREIAFSYQVTWPAKRDVIMTSGN